MSLIGLTFFKDENRVIQTSSKLFTLLDFIPKEIAALYPTIGLNVIVAQLLDIQGDHCEFALNAHPSLIHFSSVAVAVTFR